MWPRADLIDARCRGSAGSGSRRRCSTPVPPHVRQCSCRVTVERLLAAAHRLLEAERDRLVQIGAALRRAVVPAAHRAAWSTSANRSPKVGADAPLTLTEKSNPSNPNVAGSSAASRVPGRVVAAAPIRIAERLVRFGDLAELRRRHAIARIDVRVEPARQPLVRALDVVKRRRRARARGDVEIHHQIQMRICRLRSTHCLSFVHDFGVDDIAALLVRRRRRCRAAHSARRRPAPPGPPPPAPAAGTAIRPPCAAPRSAARAPSRSPRVGALDRLLHGFHRRFDRLRDRRRSACRRCP